MKNPARKNIKDLTPYEPGKPIKELVREIGVKELDVVKLASNENPIGPSPKAVKAILKGVSDINRYPDGGGFYLKQKLASVFRLLPSNFVLGNGSDELIDILTKAFLEEDQEAIISEPSFLEYGIIVRTRGSKVKGVPLKGPHPLKREISLKYFSYDIDKILNSISKKTKLIFLGNPDNPTGAYLNKKQLKELLKGMPKRIIVVFDEAYREFVDLKDYSDPFGYISRYNIIILRTMSKAYGLAGLRIGYAITDPRLAAWMERVRLPFNVNSLAQIAAVAALDDREHLNKTKKLIREGKRFIVANLKKLGFDIIESPANFILFSYKGMKGTEIFKRLLPYGVIVRDMKAYGLAEWTRVNVGTMQENRRFIKVLERVKDEIRTTRYEQRRS